jgi:hypothetical protein
MANINCGEYYLLQYSYYINDEIIYGAYPLSISSNKETILEKIKWYYENYKQHDVRIELLKINAIRIPLEIKPVNIEFKLEL